MFLQFNKSVESYFDGVDNKGEVLKDDDLQGKKLKEEINKYIQLFCSEREESNFGVIGNSLKIILEKLELSLYNNKYPGLGTQNRLKQLQGFP